MALQIVTKIETREKEREKTICQDQYMFPAWELQAQMKYLDTRNQTLISNNFTELKFC